MIKSKNPFQHTTPYTGGTTKASTITRQCRVGSHPRDTCSAFNRASPSTKWLNTILATLFSTCGSPTICSKSSSTSTPDDIPHEYTSPMNQFSYFTANIRFWETVWLVFWHDCLVFAFRITTSWLGVWHVDAKFATKRSYVVLACHLKVETLHDQRVTAILYYFPKK